MLRLFFFLSRNARAPTRTICRNGNYTRVDGFRSALCRTTVCILTGGRCTYPGPKTRAWYAAVVVFFWSPSPAADCPEASVF